MAMKNKAELIDAVKVLVEEKCGKISKKEAKEIVESIFNEMVKELKSGNEVYLPEIGKLKVKQTSARSGKVVREGKEIPWTKPAGKTVKLSLSQSLKKII